MFNWITFFVIVAAFLLAFSMGAYVALVGTLLIGIFNKRLRLHILRFILGIVLVLIVVSFALQALINVNLTEAVYVRTKAHIVNLANPLERPGLDSPFAHSSIKPRTERALAALQVWSERPILGAGLNNFAYYYPSDVAPLVHSGFILALADMGLLGFFGLGLVFATPLIVLRSLSRRGPYSSLKVLLTAFYYMIWARAIHVLITETWVKETVWLDLSMATLACFWALALWEREETV